MTDRRTLPAILTSMIFAVACGTGSRLSAQVPPVYQPEPAKPIQSILVSSTQQDDLQDESPAEPGEANNIAPAIGPTPPQRYPYLITRPTDRDWIRSMPIEIRPNRVFHIYGNAVRAGMLPHGPLGRAIFGN